MTAKSASKSAAANAKPLACFITDEVTVAAAKQAVGELAMDGALVVQGTIADAHKRLGKMPTPNLLLIDLSGAEDPIAGLASLADVCDEGTIVLTIGDVNDIGVYRNLIGLGIRDYLVKPISTDDLKAALARALNGDGDPKAANIGRLIGVVGAHGGVGATSVAVNVAWLIAQELKRRVALVDLDIFFGTCGLPSTSTSGAASARHLRTRPGSTACSSSARWRARATICSFCRPKSRSTITRPSIPERWNCSSSISATISPTWSSICRASPRAPSCSCWRRRRRWSSSPIRRSPACATASSDVSVVLNRIGVSKVGELSRADFEKGAGCKVAMSVPFDPAPFAAAAGSGKAVAATAARAKATKALRELTQIVAGQVRKDDKASVLSKFLKR